VDAKITPDTRVVYQGVGRGGARPMEGYFAQVWLEEGSQDVAATVVLGAARGRR
jgi:hypothetical protein